MLTGSLPESHRRARERARIAPVPPARPRVMILSFEASLTGRAKPRRQMRSAESFWTLQDYSMYALAPKENIIIPYYICFLFVCLGGGVIWLIISLDVRAPSYSETCPMYQVARWKKQSHSWHGTLVVCGTSVWKVSYAHIQVACHMPYHVRHATLV